MTDFVPYTPSEYAPDAPATALHFQRWFENWIAGFEGAPGAPRLDIGALARLAPGGVIRSRSDAEVASLAGGSIGGHQFAFLQAGTIRATWVHRVGSGAGGSANIARIRDGVTVALASFSNTTASVARSVDCPILPGDLLFFSNTAPAGAVAYLSFMRFQTDGGNLWPGSQARLEGNTYA